jgi:hypothetical protein
MNKQQAQFDARLTMVLSILGRRRAIKTMSATVTPALMSSRQRYACLSKLLQDEEAQPDME